MVQAQGFLTGRWYSALTILSWCVGAIGVGTSGCADSARVAKWRAGDLVHEYGSDRHAVLVRGGRRYRLGPENELVLELESVNGDEVASAPLEQFRKKGDLLVLPNGSEVHPDQLKSTHLVVHGEPLERLESHWDSRTKRHPPMIGFQLGGSAVAQILGRINVVGPLYAEVGFFAWGPEPAANGSAGVVVDLAIVGNLSTYAGGGGGFGAGVSSYAGFWHGRVGLGYRFPDHSIRIGIDGGFWYGLKGDDETAGSDEFLIPMGGFVLLYEL